MCLAERDPDVCVRVRQGERGIVVSQRNAEQCQGAEEKEDALAYGQGAVQCDTGTVQRHAGGV